VKYCMVHLKNIESPGHISGHTSPILWTVLKNKLGGFSTSRSYVWFSKGRFILGFCKAAKSIPSKIKN
jgi:hypothetical protein